MSIARNKTNTNRTRIKIKKKKDSDKKMMRCSSLFTNLKEIQREKGFLFKFVYFKPRILLIPFFSPQSAIFLNMVKGKVLKHTYVY